MRKCMRVGAIALALAGCASTSDLAHEDFLAERQPVNPAEEISADTYHPVFSGYHPRTGVEPRPWGKKNSGTEEGK